MEQAEIDNLTIINQELDQIIIILQSQTTGKK